MLTDSEFLSHMQNIADGLKWYDILLESPSFFRYPEIREAISKKTKETNKKRLMNKKARQL